MTRRTKADLTPRKINWHYIIDASYDTDYDCENSGCSEGGICRCRRISDAHVERLPAPCFIQAHRVSELWRESLAHIITLEDQLTPFHSNRIDKIINSSDNWQQYVYAAGRVLSHCLASCKPNDFDVEVGGGYYGDEIEGIYLCDDKENALRDILEWILLDAESEDPCAAIRRALKYEYGYLLDGWEDATFACGRMPLYAIHAMNAAHIRKLNRETVDGYKDLFEMEGRSDSLSSRLKRASGQKEITVLDSLPIALVDSDLRLVDGYHRVEAAKKYIESVSKPNPLVWVLVSDKEIPRGQKTHPATLRG
jgi:hypothetical protein